MVSTFGFFFGGLFKSYEVCDRTIIFLFFKNHGGQVFTFWDQWYACRLCDSVFLIYRI